MINPLIALLAAPVVIFAFFAGLRPRTAVLASYVSAWLFLPMANVALPGLPDYTKMTATGIGVMLGVLVFDGGRLLALRPRWVDLPAAVWCLGAMATSLSNGLGFYDGAASVVDDLLIYGIPYLMGRAYLADMDGLRALALAIVVGGLIYVPPCVFEIMMSPQLHRMVYGYHQHSFAQTIRYGGYRPMVFMQHGIAVAMWMASATLVGFWIGAVRRFRGPWLATFGALVVTTVACRSTGGLALLAAGTAVAVVVWKSATLGRLAVILLLLATPAYMAGRMTDLLTSRRVISLIPDAIAPARVGSLAYRLDNEDLLKDKALQRPILGWGGYNRSRVFDDEGKDLTVTDGLWIIALGRKGLVGLAGITGLLVLPPLVLVGRWPASRWRKPEVAPAVALSVALGLYAIDCLFNAMINPIYLLAVGGLMGLGRPGGTDAAPDWVALGRTLRDRGRTRDAEAAWRRALARLGPPGDDPPERRRLRADLHNDLAWLLCRDPSSEAYDPAAAAGSAAAAVEADPDHAAAWNTLGLALYRAGDPAGAIRAFERSIERGGGGAFDSFPMALAYRRMGDEARARRSLDDAISWATAHAPDHPDLLRFRAEATAALSPGNGGPDRPDPADSPGAEPRRSSPGPTA